jgi:hypothetical protein
MRPIPTRRLGASRMFWWRAYHGLVSHPKWLSLARKAEVTVPVAFAVVMWLLECASKAKPRGLVDDFSVSSCSAYLNIEEGEIERVRRALEEMGWIDHNQIVCWDEWQPDREDPNAAERKAAERKRKREAIDPVTDSHATSHNITQSSDKRRVELEKEDNPSASAAPAAPQMASDKSVLKRPCEISRAEFDENLAKKRKSLDGPLHAPPQGGHSTDWGTSSKS